MCVQIPVLGNTICEGKSHHRVPFRFFGFVLSPFLMFSIKTFSEPKYFPFEKKSVSTTRMNSFIHVLSVREERFFFGTVKLIRIFTIVDRSVFKILCPFLVGAFLKKRARLLQSLVFFYLRQTRSDER